jgi:hypothetical protein
MENYKIEVTSDILGMCDTGNKTTLKVDLSYTHGPGDINLYHYNEAGKRVVYENQHEITVPLAPVTYRGQAVFQIVSVNGESVEDDKIDGSKATIRLLDGNSYYADEFVFSATKPDIAW